MKQEKLTPQQVAANLRELAEDEMTNDEYLSGYGVWWMKLAEFLGEDTDRKTFEECMKSALVALADMLEENARANAPKLTCEGCKDEEAYKTSDDIDGVPDTCFECKRSWFTLDLYTPKEVDE